MTQIRLRIYIAPGQAEAFLNIRKMDGTHLREAAIVDTGAEISLLPLRIMDAVEYRLVNREKITVGQAGLAQHALEAYEAEVKLFVEDEFGNHSTEHTVVVWFADTDTALIGFTDILDRAILHIDMPNRTGYIEFA